jgi:hypothetical protein
MSPYSLNINDLIQYELPSSPQDEKSPPELNAKRYRVVRVLYIDPTRTYAEVMDVANRKAWNYQRRCEDILADLESGTACVLTHDYKMRTVTEEELNSWHRAKPRVKNGPTPWEVAPQVATRDRARELYGDLLTNHIPDIYDPKKRGKLVAARLEELGRKDKEEVYAIIRRFFIGGQVWNALFGDYRRCGAPLQRDTGAKRGPKTKGAWAPGIARNDTVKHALSLGIKSFLKSADRGSIQKAYDDTIKAFFSNDGIDPVTGGKTRVPWPPGMRPTRRQFITQLLEERKAEPGVIIKRQVGERDYNLNHRPKDGSNISLPWGAGSLFMVDWSILPFGILNQYRRTEAIGSPTVYAVVDFSTWFIPGVCVTLERGSWLAAMEIAEITFTEKLTFCEEFGYPLKNAEDWPADIAPDQWFADRGEFITYPSNKITDNFHTTLANEPPYRADLKGWVERYLGMVKDETILTLPGAKRWHKKRGERDPKRDIVLTQRLATRVMIDFAIDHNKNFLLPVHMMPPAALEDGVKRHPLDLYVWSLANESGAGRRYTRDYVRTHLLPSAVARVTDTGIVQGGLTYSCERAESEKWTTQAAERGPWTVETLYEPRCVDAVFLKPAREGDPPEPCWLKGKSERYTGLTWEEWDAYKKAAKEEEKEVRAEQQTARIIRRQRYDALVRFARAERDAQLKAEGKTTGALLKDIKPNLKAARTRVRKVDAWFKPHKGTKGTLTATQPQALASEPMQLGAHQLSVLNSIPSATSEVPQYIPPPTRIDAIRRNREEKERLAIQEVDHDKS